MAMNFEPHECLIFLQSMKSGTHENKAIHSIWEIKLSPIRVFEELACCIFYCNI